MAVLLALVGGISEGGGLRPAVLKTKAVTLTAEDALGKADLLPISEIDQLLAAAEDHLASPPKPATAAARRLYAAASQEPAAVSSLLTPVSVEDID